MRNIPKCKDIIAMIDLKYSDNKIAKKTGAARKTVRKIRLRIAEDPSIVKNYFYLKDEEIYYKLFPLKKQMRKASEPDTEAAYVKNAKGKAKTSLYHDYVNECQEKGEEVLRYRTFCKRIQDKDDEYRVSTNKTIKPGDVAVTFWMKELIKYSDENGEVNTGKVFVGFLPYSGCLFMKIYKKDTKDEWIDGHVHMLEYFGGAPLEIITEKTKSSCSKGEVRAEYRELAAHYRVMLRFDDDFYNEEIQKTLVPVMEAFEEIPATFEAAEELVKRTLVQYMKSEIKPGKMRYESFTRSEQRCLQKLPKMRFEPIIRKDASIQSNCHIKFENGYYSVPCKYALQKNKTVQIEVSAGTVSIYRENELIAKHKRLKTGSRRYMTIPEHMPTPEQALSMEWNPERFLSWAGSVGPATKEVIRRVLASKPIVQQTYLHCRTILQFTAKYGKKALEDACMHLDSNSRVAVYKQIENYLKNN